MQSIELHLQPTLSGDLTTIRPLHADDVEDLFKVASDPLIWDQHPFPRYEKSAFLEFFDAALATKSSFVFIDNKTKKIFGTSRFYNITKDHVFIGYTFLARSHWGGKFNREIKTLMLEYAFKFVSKVFFDIGKDNLRSRRAIEKIGARFIKYQVLREKPYSLYEIDKDTFLKTL